jgi:hypothetical protein
MTENHPQSQLQAIQTDLGVAISQLYAANIYVDSEIEDTHLSNCLIGLTKSFNNISTRLAEYQKATAIAPSSANLEGSTNGN